jgi:hypothetical protein
VQRNLLEPFTPPESQRNWATHAVCSEVLEHVDEPCRLLVNAKDYMAPDCELVVTVPGGPMSAFDRHIGHRRHFRCQDLRELLAAAGYQTEIVTGSGFPFFNLYRWVVILRGDRLIDDVASGTGKSSSAAARVAMVLFDFLFWFNLASCRWGWQIIAKARPASRGGSS